MALFFPIVDKSLVWDDVYSREKKKRESIFSCYDSWYNENNKIAIKNFCLTDRLQLFILFPSSWSFVKRFDVNKKLLIINTVRLPPALSSFTENLQLCYLMCFKWWFGKICFLHISFQSLLLLYYFSSNKHYNFMILEIWG